MLQNIEFTPLIVVIIYSLLDQKYKALIPNGGIVNFGGVKTLFCVCASVIPPELLFYDNNTYITQHNKLPLTI